MAQNIEKNDEIQSPEIMTDYEIIPHREILELKDQLKKIRQQNEGVAIQVDLLSSMKRLQEDINAITGLFKLAKEDMIKEESELAQILRPLADKLDMIIDQNKKIAEGMVAVAEIVDQRLPNNSAQQVNMPPPQPKSEPALNPMANEPPMPDLEMPKFNPNENLPDFNSQPKGINQLPSFDNNMPEFKPGMDLPNLDNDPMMKGLEEDLEVPPPKKKKGFLF